MPTYEYRCSNCRELTEAFQRMSDAPLVTCPKCGKDALVRQVSGGAGVIYKGEGWYVTDYSKKSTGGKEPESKEVASKVSGSTESGKPTAAGAPAETKTSTTSTSDTSSTAPSKTDSQV